MYEEILARFEITPEEFQKGQRTLFTSLEPLRLKVYSSKEKKKIISLATIMAAFERDREYDESGVNGVLKPIWEDYTTLRRALCDYGFLERTRDGRVYKVK